MNYYTVAYEVIEDFIQSRPDWQHFQNFAWVPKKPKDDLVFQKPAWIAEFNGIAIEFQNRIGFMIRLTPSERINSYDKDLGTLWGILARKAENASGGNTLIKMMNSGKAK